MIDVDNIAKVATPKESKWLEIAEKAEKHAEDCEIEAELNREIVAIAKKKADEAANA